MDSFASPDANPIPPAYQINRSGDADDEFSSVVESETYMPLHQAALQQQQRHHHHDDTGTPHHHHNDATAAVHEMHLALLYLLSNPDEFRAAVERGPYSSSTPNLAQWNADYCDTESLATETTANNDPAPLPYVIFADDAEVVLPQAHTASQLFGVETITGMELEAAAGIPNISTLFLRWLALMPGADHLDIIDPPGLTVMRIAGNRYRVTAAHRCYWTWMNELADVSLMGHHPPDDSASASKNHELMEGDWVCLTIVDVFETDNQGKLLSYCPTFDNRQVHKTDRNLHTLRKQATRLQTALAHSKLAKLVSQHAAAVLQQIQGKTGGNDSSSPGRNDTGSFCSSSIGPTKFSGYMGDGEGERHEV